MSECEIFMDLCSASIDGELDEAQQAALDAHLAVCPACAEYMGLLRDMHGMLAMDKIDAPSSLHEDIMELVLAEAQTHANPVPKRRYVPVFTLIAAAAVVVLLVTTGTIGDWLNNSYGSGSVDTAVMAQPPVTSGAMGADAGTAAEPRAARAAMDTAGAQSYTSDNVEGSEQSETAVVQSATDNESMPAAFRAAPAEEQETLKTDAVKLPATPAALQEQSYAFCYVIHSVEEPPDFDGVLIAESEDRTASYYTIKNSTSDVEAAISALAKKGYNAVLRTDVPDILLDKTAEFGLIILMK